MGRGWEGGGGAAEERGGGKALRQCRGCRNTDAIIADASHMFSV